MYGSDLGLLALGLLGQALGSSEEFSESHEEFVSGTLSSNG